MFQGFETLRPACEARGLPFPNRPEDHIGVVYLTTAVQTAVFAAIVLVIRPERVWIARGTLVVLALAFMTLNLPNRKGLSVALLYLTSRGES